MSTAIESVLNETRVFEPSAGVRRPGAPDAGRLPPPGAPRPTRTTAATGPSSPATTSSGTSRSRRRSTSPRRRSTSGSPTAQLNASYNCLDRHLDTTPNRCAIIFEADDGTVTRVTYKRALRARLPVRQRPEEARHQEGRPRPHLPADVDRGGRRDAGLRADRRDPLGRVRRLLGQERPRAHRRRRRAPGHHRRRPDARRQGNRAEARGRRGAGDGRLRARSRVSSSTAAPAATSPGTTSATSGGTTSSPACRTTAGRRRSRPSTRCSSSTRRAPPASRRASSTRPGGYLLRRRLLDEVDVRHQDLRRLLVHRRRGLGHRPHLRRLRSAGGRRDAGDLRGRADVSQPRRGSGR